MSKPAWPVILACLTAAWSLTVSADGISKKEVPTVLQAQIIKFYSQGRCEEVRNLVRNIDFLKLRPNVLAITAYCEPDGLDPEVLFALAEDLNPTGDLILTLHAKYRWKKDPDPSKTASKALWQKLLMLARNDYFRVLAKDYLAGVAPSGDPPLDLSPQTGFARVFLGSERRTNPQPAELGPSTGPSSWGLTAKTDLSWRRWYPFGSLAADYSLNAHSDFSVPRFNEIDNNVEFPVAVHVAAAKDVIFRPFFGYSRLGGESYQGTYGLGVKGAVYNSGFIQSVQGSIFTDRGFVPELAVQQGAHYRFEYQWDFFPPLWFFSTLIAVEHVSAQSTASLLGSTGYFEMDHTDLSLNLQAERDFNHFALALAPLLAYRLDSHDSTYTTPPSSVAITKRRGDWTTGLQASASIPVYQRVQMYAWWEWKQVFSNLGPGDYVDRNYRNVTVGLGIRTAVSTY